MTESAPTAPTTPLEKIVVDSARNSGHELAHLDRHLAGLGDLCHDIRVLAGQGRPGPIGTKLTELATKINVAREIVDRATQFRAHAEGAATALPAGHAWERALPGVITAHALSVIGDGDANG